MAAGQMAIAGVVPAKVGALMEGVIKAMLITKLKTVSAVLLMSGMCALAGGLLTRPTAAQQAETAKPPAEGRKGGEATKSEPPARVRNAEKEHDKPGRERATADSPVTPSYVAQPPDVLFVKVVVKRPEATSQRGYECLVRPDGTIALGANGTVKVAGRSLDQIRAAIVDHLTPKAGDNAKVEVQVHVIGYNSKVYYVIAKRKEGEQVYRCPDTGSDTVVAAILRVQGLAESAVKGRVWVARPSGDKLEVNWQAITQQGKTDTNYLLRSGDRVFVEEPLPE
jgi:protein involved in polysaccharide export with SLBB domain